MQNIPNLISDIFCISIVNGMIKSMFKLIKKGAKAPFLDQTT